MCEKLDIDDKTRFLVLHFDAKMTAPEIAKILSRSRTTIYDWELRTKRGQDIRGEKKRCGRPKSIKKEVENKLIQMVKENPEGASLKKLAARYGISSTSVSKMLARRGFKYKAFAQGIVYTEDEKMNRVEFCKRMLYEEGKAIYQTFFTDEMGIDLTKTRKNKAWQIPTEKIKRKNITKEVKLECWGAISAKGATSLDIYDTYMDGNLYRQVIERHKAEMMELYPDGDFYFLQDYHPVHRMNEEWIVNEPKLGLIKLPKRSPDLNLIESLWVALKERVKSDAPTNKRELKASLLKGWEVLTKPERLQPFFEGLHRRYVECVAREGQKLSKW